MAKRVRANVEIEVPEGDTEGVYREEYHRRLAKRIVNILLNMDTEPARDVIENILREKEKGE